MDVRLARTEMVSQLVMPDQIIPNQIMPCLALVMPNQIILNNTEPNNDMLFTILLALVMPDQIRQPPLGATRL